MTTPTSRDEKPADNERVGMSISTGSNNDQSSGLQYEKFEVNDNLPSRILKRAAFDLARAASIGAIDVNVERCFYTRSTHNADPARHVRHVLRAPSHGVVLSVLRNLGFSPEYITQALPPNGRPDRLDGTILVAVDTDGRSLMTYGPFNDQTDARHWIEQESSRRLNEGRSVFTIIDPDDCLRIEMIEGRAKLITLPESFLNRHLSAANDLSGPAGSPAA